MFKPMPGVPTNGMSEVGSVVAALDAAGVALFDVDRMGERVTLSPAACRILGLAPTGQPPSMTLSEWKILIHPDDKAEVDGALRVSPGDDPRVVIARTRRSDETWLWIRYAFGPPSSDDGDIQHCTLVDVTAEKGHANSLESHLESIGTGTWDWHVQTNALVTNRAYHRMLGETQPSGALDGRYFFERVHPDDAPDIHRAVERALNGTDPTYASEVRLRCSDGSYRWIRATGSVVERTARGEPVRMVGYHFDAHDYVAQRQQLVYLEHNLRLFVQNTPAAVAMFDREIRYKIVSDGWNTQYGLGDQDIIGRSHYEVFPTIPERWKVLHQRALAGETLSCDRDPFAREDGLYDLGSVGPGSVAGWRRRDRRHHHVHGGHHRAGGA